MANNQIIDKALAYLGGAVKQILTSTGTKTATGTGLLELTTITLQANTNYLILASIRQGLGADTQVSCEIFLKSGTASRTFGTTANNTTGVGQGTPNWLLVKTSTACVFGVRTYIYTNSGQGCQGWICAIPIGLTT